jgi:hypothetical protein
MRLDKALVGWSVEMLAVIVLFGGCSVFLPNASTKGTKYRYTYHLKVSPEMGGAIVHDPANLLFQDDSIIVQFRFDDAAAFFQLQNLSESFLTLDYAKFSFEIDRQTYPVCHSLNFYSDTAVRPGSVTLRPMSFIKDYVAPRGNITFDGSRWQEKDLFPTVDHSPDSSGQSIKKHVGKTFALVMPLTFGGQQRNYVFEFQIASADILPWTKYQRPVRSPSAPQKPTGFFTLDQVAAGIVVAGLLGFSAYLLTLRKDINPDLR